jgi:hypothetical protein
MMIFSPRSRRAYTSKKVAAILFVQALATSVALASWCQAYEIGHTSITFVDAGRGNRQVATEIYYPSETPGDNVPVADPPAGGFPVVAFGHGYMISWSYYDYLWQNLVPAGFVVALPKTGGELFPNHLEFGRDIAFVSRALRGETSNPSSLFYGVLSGAAAIGGHSMGGGASFLGASEDSTASAIFNLAAAETNPSAIAAASEIAAPALLFSGSVDCVTPPPNHQIPMYGALSSWCKTHVTLTGASHCQFAESNVFCNLGESGCGSPTLTRSEQQGLTLEVLTPWLRATLESDPAGWSDFQAAIDTLPDVTYVQDCPAAGIPEDRWGRGADPGDSRSALVGVRVWPNPFSHESHISFVLRGSAHVRLDIVDAKGRLVGRVADRVMPAGGHTLTWSIGGDDTSSPAPGIYLYNLVVGGGARSGKLILAR